MEVASSLIIALVLCTGWNLRVSVDNDIYNDMRHPVCLLTIDTAASAVNIAEGGSGRTRTEGSSVAELGGGSVVFLVLRSEFLTKVETGYS